VISLMSLAIRLCKKTKGIAGDEDSMKHSQYQQDNKNPSLTHLFTSFLRLGAPHLVARLW